MQHSCSTLASHTTGNKLAQRPRTSRKVDVQVPPLGQRTQVLTEPARAWGCKFLIFKEKNRNTIPAFYSPSPSPNPTSTIMSPFILHSFPTEGLCVPLLHLFLSPRFPLLQVPSSLPPWQKSDFKTSSVQFLNLPQKQAKLEISLPVLLN